MSATEDASAEATAGVKRAIEEAQGEGETSKRVAHSAAATPAAEASYMIKLLCPEPAIGLVIGKKGSILQEIIASTTAAIKISQNSQLYPGTADRTISIRGSTEVMLVALDRIIQRIIEALCVRICIPQLCAGALIGTGGSTIRRLIETTGCHLKLAEAGDESHSTKERLLAISAPLVETVVAGASAVLNVLVIECKTSFAYVNTEVAYASPTSGFAPSMFAPQQMMPPAFQAMQPQYQQPVPQYHPQQQPVPMQQQHMSAAQSAGGEKIAVPPPVAPSTQFQAPPQYMQPMQQPMQQFQQPQQYAQAQGYAQSVPAQYQQQYFAFDPNTFAPYPLSTDIADMPPPSYSVDALGNVTGTFLIPERYMGGVLGRGGTIVKNINQVTGAAVKASQKGDVVEGYPDFRMVRLIGTNAQVQQAALMLTNRLVELVNNPRLGRS